jgi:hypothetical protein
MSPHAAMTAMAPTLCPLVNVPAAISIPTRRGTRTRFRLRFRFGFHCDAPVSMSKNPTITTRPSLGLVPQPAAGTRPWKADDG